MITVPDLILWLSYFYTSSELSLRLSWFWISRYLTMVVTSVMAYGLLHMRGVHNMAGWRWLFLIEGIITTSIGIASFFLMPASATQTKTWFRPKGWFTDREVGIVVNRVLRDDPSKGDMNNRTGLSFRNLWDAVTDYDLWPVSLNVDRRERAIANVQPDLPHRHRLHGSPIHARSIHHPDPTIARLRPVQRQPALNPQPVHQLFHTIRRNMVQRIHRTTHARGIRPEHLATTLFDCAPMVARRRSSKQRMGNFRPPHRPAEHPIHPPDQRIPLLAQLRLRPHTLRLRRFLQHVRASRHDHLLEHLPRGRQTLIPPRQRNPHRHRRPGDRAVRRREGILRVEE